MGDIREVISHARANGGILTVQEAAALGMSKATFYRRVNEGVFVRVGDGVVALPGTATRSDIALRAANRALGAVVSHQSAAKAHGLGPIADHTPSVTVTHRGSNRFEGVVVHQSTDLLPAHVEDVNGLRTTNVVRTTVDLAQVLRPNRLARVVDNALASRAIELEELASMQQALTRRGKPGMRNLRTVIESRAGQPALKTSELEAELIDLIDRVGLPEPVREFHAPWLKPIDGRVDLAYIDSRVIIEADGRRWHTLFDAFEIDRRRDNAAQLAGWVVLRFTWRMIREEPSSVAGTIRSALEARKVHSAGPQSHI